MSATMEKNKDVVDCKETNSVIYFKLIIQRGDRRYFLEKTATVREVTNSVLGKSRLLIVICNTIVCDLVSYFLKKERI